MRMLDQTGAAETQGPIDEQNMLRWQTTDAFSGSHGLQIGRRRIIVQPILFFHHFAFL